MFSMLLKKKESCFNEIIVPLINLMLNIQIRQLIQYIPRKINIAQHKNNANAIRRN